MSQRDLAKAAGVDVRQIRRYEAGEQQPLLSVAIAIADALGITVAELAGKPSHRIKLGGVWWALARLRLLNAVESIGNRLWAKSWYVYCRAI